MYQLLWKNHIEPAFERENMRDISGFEIDRLLSSKYKQGYASQTVLRLRSVLSKMFKTAIKWRWLVENPTKGIEAPPTRVKRQQRALSVEEVSLLFEHLENPARLIVIIGVVTGLRIGEILGLRVEDLGCDTLPTGGRGAGAMRVGRRTERIENSPFRRSWARRCRYTALSAQQKVGCLSASPASR
jgi:integrase